MPIKFSFAHELRLERARLGYSRAKLAKALDVAARTVEVWEADDPKRQPMEVTKEGVLARLAKLRPEAVPLR